MRPNHVNLLLVDRSEHDAELRDLVRVLLDRYDAEERFIAAIHLERAWLALGGCLDPNWLRAQLVVLNESIR